MNKTVYFLCKEFGKNACQLANEVIQVMTCLAGYRSFGWTFLLDQPENGNSIADCFHAQHPILAQTHCQIKRVSAKNLQESLADSIDFIVTFGGDGTILNASSRFQRRVPPILAFNFGSLGFLSYFSFEHHEAIIQKLMADRLGLIERRRISCRIHKRPLGSIQEYQALNEIIVERGPSSFMVNLDVFQNGHFLTSVHADGIIAATATGSTAYSLSAGGCLVHPDVPAILFTPICPHTLSFRPMVLPSTIRLRISLSENSRTTAWVSCDSRMRAEIEKDDFIEIQMGPFSVPCYADNEGSDLKDEWFSSLSRCLHWNIKKTNEHITHQ